MGLLRTALPCFGIAFAMATAHVAVAQQRAPGQTPPSIRAAEAWYAGVGAGVSYYNYQDGVFSSPTSRDQTGFGWKVFGGYRFSPYFGVEGSYVDLGSTQVATTTGQSVGFSVHSWNVAAVGRVPFASGFSIQGKVGAAFTRTVGFSDKHYRTNVLLGAGVGYDFANGVSLLGEYEYFGKAGEAVSVDPNTGFVTGTGRADAHLFSVSTMLRF